MRLERFQGRSLGLESGVGGPDPLLFKWEFLKNDDLMWIQFSTAMQSSGERHIGYGLRMQGSVMAKYQIGLWRIWDLRRKCMIHEVL